MTRRDMRLLVLATGLVTLAIAAPALGREVMPDASESHSRFEFRNASSAPLTTGGAAGVPHGLAKQARWEAAHGGVLGTAHGAATARMKHLSRLVIEARFRPAGAYAVRMAVCLVGRESGFNPGAISRTGDFGLAQVNKLAHYETYKRVWHRILDPVLNAGIMWSLSSAGTNWQPWSATRGGCP